MNSKELFYLRIVSVLFVLTFITLPGLTQGDTETIVNPIKNDSVGLTETAKQRLNELTKISKRTKEENQVERRVQADSSFYDPMLPNSPNPLFSDSLTNEKYQAALQEYYDYHVSGLQHRKKVFKWQLFSSKIIFAVVLILVFAGIYFAAIQFHIGVKQAKENSRDFNDHTEITASMKGIKVSSPVLGVIILVISLAFFYLYLVYVFPIEDIF